MIITLDKAVEVAQKLREEGRKIVTTNGCFDILHVGHARYLRAARKLGDVLIVGVNSDRNPYFRAKPGRPIVPEKERLEMLDALKPVDYVFPFDDGTPNKWVEKVRPDFHVKASGKYYTIKDCVEKGSVEKAGGKVVLIPKTEDKSTTNIVEQVLKTYRSVKK